VESWQIILGLLQLVSVMYIFSLVALVVCSLVRIILVLFYLFSFRVAPFNTIPILAFHLISYLLSHRDSLHFLRLASGHRASALPGFIFAGLADLLKQD